MISLEQYKKEIISHYHHGIDASFNKREERTITLSKNYSDEYLQKIIFDTYGVITNILDNIKGNYYKIELPEENTAYINLNLSGGFFSDRIFIDYEGHLISETILKKVFGRQFMAYISDESYEERVDADDDMMLVSVRYLYYLYMQGFPSNIEELKNNVLKRGIVLKKDN